MGSVNSSAETRQRAHDLADQIGSYHLSLAFDAAVSAALNIFTVVTGLVHKFRVDGGSLRENLALRNVLARPLQEGRLVQTDEEDMGLTYDELSDLGRIRKQSACGPYTTFCRLIHNWRGSNTPAEIATKVTSLNN